MDELELELDDIAQGGDGVGRWQGRVIFAAGGLPGELVRVRLADPNGLRSTRAFLRSEVVAVLRPAPERAAPRLPGASHVPWQHIAYPHQVRFKEAILAAQLNKLAGIADVPLHPMIPAPRPWGYRNTARLHAQNGRIGYYAAGTHDVVDMDEDPLLLPVLNDALRGLRAVLASGKRATGDESGLHGVTLRASAAYGYAIAALHGSGNLLGLATQWRARVPALASVTCTTEPNQPATPGADDALRQATSRRNATVAGSADATLHEELGRVVFSLTVDSFFQVHSAQAARLLEVTRGQLALQPGARLLDAYSGAGTFALPLAHGLREVVAIEEYPCAVADGQRSAALNAIANVRFVTAPVERAAPRLEPPFDGVVLDPPRRGCHPAALAALIALSPPRIAYISCHPGILARDLRPLLDGGYHLVEIQPVDLFPQTPHIECVALLVR